MKNVSLSLRYVHNWFCKKNGSGHMWNMFETSVVCIHWKRIQNGNNVYLFFFCRDTITVTTLLPPSLEITLHTTPSIWKPHEGWHNVICLKTSWMMTLVNIVHHVICLKTSWMTKLVSIVHHHQIPEDLINDEISQHCTPSSNTWRHDEWWTQLRLHTMPNIWKPYEW